MKKIVWSPVLLFLSVVFFVSGPIDVLAQDTQTVSSYSVSDFEQKIIARTNADRSAEGKPALKFNAALSAAAQQKADDMLKQQYFAHTSPAGVAPWHWFASGGYTYMYAGENLAMDFYEPAMLEAAWMASPTHRANILNGMYKDIGLGIVQGAYQGKPTIFVVEFFGTQPSAVAHIKTTKKLATLTVK